MKLIKKPDKLEEVSFSLKKSYWTKELCWIERGAFFEYYENPLINFKFFYVLGKVSILRGSYLDDYSPEEVETNFSILVKLEDLFSWLDSIQFECIKCIPTDTMGGIKGLYKFGYFTTIYSFSDDPILSNYCEFKINNSTIIRSYPYLCYFKKLGFDVINNEDKKYNLYWIVLCLLKYQKQLEMQSER